MTRGSGVMGHRLAVLLAGAGIGAAFVVALQPGMIRIGLAAAIVGMLALISLRSPQAAVLLILTFLPWLALLRRVLIPLSGWQSYDVLLMIAPALAIVLGHRLFVMERRPLAKDGLSKLVLALFVLAVLESVNPEGGGLRAGMTGVLFLGVPLMWFFIGREFADRRFVGVVMTSTVLSGVAAAAYGLMQQQVGFPSWDGLWVKLNGYEALDILGTTRAFGPFSSSAEYATFVAIALVLALLGILYRGRRWLLAVPLVPLLAYALFLQSSRGIIILVLAALTIALGLRTGRLGRVAFFACLTAATALAITGLFGPQLTEMANRSGNPLIKHQVAGLMNPLDPERSTYLVHEQIALYGLVTAVQHPLGMGTATTNLAGLMLGAPTVGTEVDLTNAFVSLGVAGGLIFLAMFIIALCRAGSLGLSNRDAVTLGAMGVLILTFGQWLNGGYYAVAPLVWILIGWINREWQARQSAMAAQPWMGPWQAHAKASWPWFVRPDAADIESSESRASA